MAAFTLALINNHEAGKPFFETYNIPYQVITRGENKGKLRVKVTRSLDGQAVLDARKELEYAGYGFLADHSNVFRDEDDRTVVTFSPYNAVPKVIDVPGYDVEVSVIIPGFFEPPVRILRAAIPENESHAFR